MTPEEQEAVLQFPDGYKHLLLVIACTKRALLHPKLRSAQRLDLLERLNGMADVFITPDVLAVIEPMGETEMQMVCEARSLDSEDDRLASTSFDVLTRPDVFAHFLELNPSLLAAIKMQAASRQQANTQIPTVPAAVPLAPYAAAPNGQDWQWAKSFNPIPLR